ncbi:hypothetical protein CO610_10870 [Lysobacteraceae bacterium NML95-0200]|nr:hypothetical protein CO610_10870 [Xanthomonadaceae bacterium NML95-0200]
MNHDSPRAEGIEALTQALADVGQHSLRHISAYIAQPLPALWNNTPALDTLRRFATERAMREVRLLFADASGLARDYGALVALAQRLPSHILLRQAATEFSPPASQSFILGDGALVLFDSGERPAATHTRTAQHIRPLAERFADAWERARPISEIRALGI